MVVLRSSFYLVINERLGLRFFFLRLLHCSCRYYSEISNGNSTYGDSHSLSSNFVTLLIL